MLYKEAVRVIQSLPRWTPGNQQGKPVRVKYTVPVTFALQWFLPFRARATTHLLFRTHVRNLQFSFRVRFFISLRFIQNDMFVIPVCEGSHRKRTIWRKMFHFIGARSEWWWGVTAVRVWSCRRNRQTRFSVRSGIVIFASDYFSPEGTYKWQAM